MVARSVVVGMGAVTVHGSGVAATWAGVRDGLVGVAPITKIDLGDEGPGLGVEIHQDVLPDHDYPRPPGFREPLIDYALHAAEEAMGQAAALRTLVPAERFGLCLGITVGGALSSVAWYRDVYAGRPTEPRLLALSPQFAATEVVGGAFGLKGPAITFACACATGAITIGAAVDLVRLGHADAVLAGGSEAVFEPLWYGLLRGRLISRLGARPFSADRDGLSPGEGSGMLVITTPELAAQAGLPCLGEILGYGTSSDAYNRSTPDPTGAGVARAMVAALGAAGIDAAGIDYINAHGTGTELNDVSETRAVKLALGAHAREVPMSSVKGGIGHLGGAAGAVEAIVTLKALEEQLLPPTAAYSLPDPECDLDAVPVARRARIRAAVSNNFGFGGANAALVLSTVSGAQVPTPTLAAAQRVCITGFAAIAPDRSPRPDGSFRLDFDPRTELAATERRHVDRLGMLSLVAARRALAGAGRSSGAVPDERLGVIFGTGLGPMESHEEMFRPLMAEGIRAISPAVVPNNVQNAAAGYTALWLKALGPTSTISSGHAAGGAALAYAADEVALGRASAVVWIAADTLTEWVVDWYRGQGMLERMRVAEGAFAAVLEPLSAARARGAEPLAEIVSWGAASDGLGLGRADAAGGGIERAMRSALERGSTPPGEIERVWGAGCGLADLDAGESAAVGRVFGGDAGLEWPLLELGTPIGAAAGLLLEQALRAGIREPVLLNASSAGGCHHSLLLRPPAG